MKAAMQNIQQLEKEVQRLKLAMEELSHIGQNLLTDQLEAQRHG